MVSYEMKSPLVLLWSMIAVIVIGFGTLLTLCVVDASKKQYTVFFSVTMIEQMVFLAMFGIIISLFEFSMSLFVAYIGLRAEMKKREVENMMLVCAGIVMKMSQGDETSNNAYDEVNKNMKELLRLRIEELKSKNDITKPEPSCAGSADSMENNAVKAKEEISPVSESSSSRSAAFTQSD
jgi:hypothetical protein